MKLAMYKGPATEALHKLAHKGTCLWTFSEYSHCELVFGEKDVNGNYLCASSSIRDGGVRFKRIDIDSGKWDVYPMNVTNEEESYAYQWFVNHQGAPYDYLGLAWFVLPINSFDNPSKFFCSEAVAASLQLDKPHKYHPEKLFRKVTQ